MACRLKGKHALSCLRIYPSSQVSHTCAYRCDSFGIWSPEAERESKGKRERHLDGAYQCYDPVELLYFLLQLTEARRQPVMQWLELLRQFLPVDADPFREQRDLEERT